jgi:hypothetical protein
MSNSKEDRASYSRGAIWRPSFASATLENEGAGHAGWWPQPMVRLQNKEQAAVTTRFSQMPSAVRVSLSRLAQKAPDAAASIASRPNVRDDREAPLFKGAGRPTELLINRISKGKYFCPGAGQLFSSTEPIGARRSFGRRAVSIWTELQGLDDDANIRIATNVLSGAARTDLEQQSLLLRSALKLMAVARDGRKPSGVARAQDCCRTAPAPVRYQSSASLFDAQPV